ncbi:MAG: hypothetical protein H7707_00320, partial [Acetobacter sp.]|nr:hypothetical protein [Acetobacter sp.]
NSFIVIVISYWLIDVIISRKDNVFLQPITQEASLFHAHFTFSGLMLEFLLVFGAVEVMVAHGLEVTG